MMKVNLCVREPKEFLNYVPFESMTVGNVNFHLPILLKEVKHLPKVRKKHFKKIAVSFLTTLGSIVVLGSKSMANTLPPSSLNQTGQVTTNLPTGTMGIPPELSQFLSSSLLIMVSVAVVLCIGMLIAAGVLRALRKRKEASEWTVDIVKGLTQVILAAPIVFLIYFIATILFSGTGWFISPFAIK